MNKRLQGFIAGFLVCCLILGTTVFSAGVTKTIKAVFNQITVKIDSKAIGGDKISFNGNVYINTKSVANLLGKTHIVDKTGNIAITTKKDSLPTNSKASKGKEVVFPDKDLDKIIRVGINKPNGTIYEDDLLKINQIDAYSKENICNLEGIQYIKNLKSIILDSEGDLEDIGLLANLKELHTIILDNKKITDISALYNLKSLKTLSLDGNDINNIDIVKNLTGLKTFRIANNNIKTLKGIENLVNLEQISFGGNSISDISYLKNLSKLKEYYKSFENLVITEDNKFYILNFIPVINDGKKNYFFKRNSFQIYIDENNKIYINEVSSITTLLNATKKQYNILKSVNPFIDGILDIKNNDFKNESKSIYTSINSSYKEGKIINKDGTLSYEYSYKPNDEKGVIKIGNRNYLYPLEDIFKTFGITFSVEFDKEKKLCGFRITC